MNYFVLYPLSFFLNFSSLTLTMVCLNLMGYQLLSVYIALIHSISLFTIKSFSGEARTLANHKSSSISLTLIFQFRLLLTIPCILFFLFFSIKISNLHYTLILPFLIRLILEWFEEIFLIEIEKNKELSQLKFLFLYQLLSILSCFLIILFFKNLFIPLLLWSLASLFFLYKYYYKIFFEIFKNFKKENLFFFKIKKLSFLLRNIGSTFILGFLIYIFRETLVNFVGIEDSSDFFSAFAIGGILASYFSNSLGYKSVIFFNRTLKSIDFYLIIILTTKFIFGIILILLTINSFSFFEELNGSIFFRSLGFSLIGATIMIIAQIKRFKLLKNRDVDFFGVNLIINVVLIILIPIFYHLFDISIIGLIFLISSILYLIFIYSYENNLSENSKRFVIIFCIFFLIFPIFFQLNGQVFVNEWAKNSVGDFEYNLGLTSFIYDHKNELKLLPLPFSLIGCILAIIFIGAYKKAKVAFLFISVNILICSLIIITAKIPVEFMNQKFINLCQTIIPYSGLIAGLMIFKNEILEKFILEKILFYFLIFFIPLQIFSSYTQNVPALTPFIYLFSIYQHLQYVPTIFVVSFVIVLIQLWNVKYYKYFLIPLTFLMYMYCKMSDSTMVMYFFYSFLTVFSLYLVVFNLKLKNMIFLSSIILAVFASNKVVNLSSHLNNISEFTGKALEEKKFKKDLFKDDLKIKYDDANFFNTLKDNFPRIFIGFENRFQKWSYYLSILSKNDIFIYGDNKQRNLLFKPHNYYLDMTYHYGLLSIFPIITFFVYTLFLIIKTFKIRGEINPSIMFNNFYLFLIICFFIIIDNNFKVSLKQPYSGIFIFFIWGKLLCNLHYINKKNSSISLKKI